MVQKRHFGNAFRQDKGHRSAWSAFLAAMSTGGEPPIPYDHLLGVSSATLAAVSAVKERSKSKNQLTGRSFLPGSSMKLTNIVLAVNELGLQPVLRNGLYRLGLISGYYRYRTPPIPYSDKSITAQNKEHAVDFVAKLLSIVEPVDVIRQKIIATADEITRGTTQLYGVIPTTINFGHQPASAHWCDYELGKINIETHGYKRYLGTCPIFMGFSPWAGIPSHR